MDEEGWRPVFERSHELGIQLVRAAGQGLPAELDESSVNGHLLRLCLQQQKLTLKPVAADKAVPKADEGMCSGKHVQLLIVAEPVLQFPSKLPSLD